MEHEEEVTEFKKNIPDFRRNNNLISYPSVVSISLLLSEEPPEVKRNYEEKIEKYHKEKSKFMIEI